MWGCFSYTVLCGLLVFTKHLTGMLSPSRMRIYEIGQVRLLPFYRWGKRSSEFNVTKLVASKPGSEQRASLSSKPAFSHPAYTCCCGHFLARGPQPGTCAFASPQTSNLCSCYVYWGFGRFIPLPSRSLLFPWLASWRSETTGQIS